MKTTYFVTWTTRRPVCNIRQKSHETESEAEAQSLYFSLMDIPNIKSIRLCQKDNDGRVSVNGEYNRIYTA